MQANIFKPNTPFRVDDAHYIIQTTSSHTTDTDLYCKPYDPETGKPEKTRTATIFSASELKRLIFNEEACLLDPYFNRFTSMSLTDKQIHLQEMWLEFVYFHLERCEGLRPQADQLVDESIKLFDWHSYGFGPWGRSSCQEKISAFIHSEHDPRSLVNWGGISDKGQSRLPDAVEQVILECIVEKYLVRKDDKENSKNKVADIIISRLKELRAYDSIKYSVVPSKATIYKRFETLEPLTVAEKQLSKQEQNRLKRKLRRQLVGNYPLERVEMDAIYVAIGLLDEDGKTYLGSVVIMVAIDTFTRAVVGYAMNVGEGASESADLAVECLKNSVYPKDNPDWRMCGLMTHIVHDPSTSITGNLFKKAALDIGVIPITVRANEPWAKPFIERFFLTLRIEFLAELPGYLGSKRFRGTRHLNPNDTLQNHATLTVSEFKQKFEEFITDYYHESGHAGLNYRSPADVWNHEIDQNIMLAIEPNTANDLSKYRGIQVSDRTLYELGYVKIANEIYCDDDLKSLWLRGVRKVTVQYSNIDASSVVIPIADARHQKSLGKSLIIAQRRETSYKPELPFRSALDAARNGVHGHLDEKGKIRYTTGKGVEKVSPKPPAENNDQDTTSPQHTKPATVNNSKAIDTEAANAKAQIDNATKSWSKTPKASTVHQPKQQTKMTLTVGEEL